jgi:hypothetical protein
MKKVGTPDMLCFRSKASWWPPARVLFNRQKAFFALGPKEPQGSPIKNRSWAVVQWWWRWRLWVPSSCLTCFYSLRNKTNYLMIVSSRTDGRLSLISNTLKFLSKLSLIPAGKKHDIYTHVINYAWHGQVRRKPFYWGKKLHPGAKALLIGLTSMHGFWWEWV